MEFMSPEERFTRIENFLNATAEHQAQHAEQMAALTAGLAAVIESQAKHEAAIRDLIVVSRTTLNSISELRESQNELREAQKLTEDKLHILIETVDRIIREKK